MPRFPKGMVRKRKAFYLRSYKKGEEIWTPLGSDYDLACARLKHLREQPILPNRGTVSQLVDRWLTAYVATARNEKNVRLARQRADDFFKAFLGMKPVTRVTADHLREYRLWLEGRKLARQTVAHVLSDARCFFRWAEDAGYVARSPFPRRLLPRIQERPPDRLDEDEVVRLTALSEPWGFVMRLGLGSGLRWGEMMRVKASDVRSGVLIVANTKNTKVRRIPLPPELAAEVRGRVGLLVPQTNYWHSVLRMRKLSGVSRFHPHQLRHTFACSWLEKGGSLAALQQMLGHASIVTTQRYARLTDEAVQREAERVHREQTGNAVC